MAWGNNYYVNKSSHFPELLKFLLITTFLLAADNTVEYILAALENYRVHSAESHIFSTLNIWWRCDYAITHVDAI